MKLEILIGPIASGKSTYARDRADEGALIVAHDDLTTMLHARYRYEQSLRDCYRVMEEVIVATSLGVDRDAIVDRTHLTRESRSRWVNFARQFIHPRTEIVAVAFPIEAPEAHAARRFACDPRGRSIDEWLMVARHHDHQTKAEPLKWRAEGFDSLINIRP